MNVVIAVLGLLLFIAPSPITIAFIVAVLAICHFVIKPALDDLTQPGGKHRAD